MKNLATAFLAVFTISPVSAADSSTLKFGGERIGVPPLSLTESLASSAKSSGPIGLGPGLPRFAGDPKLPANSPQLIPRLTPSLEQIESARATATPRVSRASGLPIIIPSDAVDYKMTIVRPDPSIDFKLAIKHPAPADPVPAK